MVHRSQLSYTAGQFELITHPPCKHLQGHSSSDLLKADMHNTPSDSLRKRIPPFARRVWCASGSDSELITSCSPSQVLPLHVGGQPSTKQMLQNRIAPKKLILEATFLRRRWKKHHDVSHQQRQNSHATCSQNTRKQARTVVQSFYC